MFVQTCGPMTAETAILLSKKSAARLLGISIGMLDKLRRQRQIEAVRVGRRVMFRRDSIEFLALTPTQRKSLRTEAPSTLN